MKGKEKSMKNIFIKLSKIITYICIAEIVLMIIFLIAFGSNDNVTIPNWVGIIFLGTLYITLVFLIIAFILGVIDAVKKRDKRYFIEFIIMVIFLFAIQIIGNLVSKESEGILTVSLTALGMGIAVKAGKYIFHK